MHLVYRDSLLLLVCFGFVLSSDVAKHVQGDIASTPPRLDDGDEKGAYTETSSSTAPSTSVFSSTTITSTTSTSTTTTAGTSESSPSAGTPPVFALARANTTPSSSASIKSIAATTRTTPPPSAKRQISLNEFQQLVAKVNDEIGMLRNQSANLSQTYDELVRRYNERTSQIPIVLYDVTNCSNDSTIEEKQHTTAPSDREGSMQLAVEGTTNARGLEGSTGAARTTAIPSTITASTVAALSSTETVPPKNDAINLGDAAQSAPTPETVPQNPSNAQTQIYGNKYYNYVHYFMYPPSEDLLKEVLSPPNTNFRRKEGPFSPNVATIRHRHAGHGLAQGEYDSLEEESTGNGNAAKDNRWRFPPNYRRRPWNERERPQPVPNYVMAGPLDSPAPSAPPAAPASFPYEIPYRRRINANPRPSFNEDLVRPNPVNYLRTEERTTQRNPYLDELPLGGLSKPTPAERFYPQPPVKPQKPVIDTPAPEEAPSERLESFLERRRKVNVPVKQPVTPWQTTVATERSTTPPSLDSLISGGLKSVSFSIPTTVKPVPGVARNGWDGYDFTFVRKVFENQKRNQAERRTERLIGRSL